jgi:hypothetical protein
MDEKGERIFRGHTAVLLQGAALHKCYALGNITASSVHMTCQTVKPLRHPNVPASRFLDPDSLRGCLGQWRNLFVAV